MREQTQTVEAWLEEVRTVRAEIQRAYDHDIAVLLAEITTLRAEQTRLREALERQGGWIVVVGEGSWQKCHGVFDSYDDAIWWMKQNQFITSDSLVLPVNRAALSSTPTPEPSK